MSDAVQVALFPCFAAQVPPLHQPSAAQSESFAQLVPQLALAQGNGSQFVVAVIAQFPAPSHR